MIEKAFSHKYYQWLLSSVVLLLSLGFLKLAKSIMIPFVVSLFLSFLLIPGVRYLKKYKVPHAISTILSLMVSYALIVGFGYLIFISLESVQSGLPAYVTRLKSLLFELFAWVNSKGVEVNANEMLKNYDFSTLYSLAGYGVNVLVTLMQYGLLIFFLTLFILLEYQFVGQKLSRAMGHMEEVYTSATTIARQVQRYLFVKTIISAATGFIVWFFLSLTGTDFPIVWGLLTFLLNFIPSVGSIVASVPPVFVALLQGGESPIQQAVIVAVGLLLIQTLIGSYLDPKFMGHSLNISPLVVFGSMVFWGWMWGPVGMLLAVPIAVTLKIILYQIPATKPISIMLSGPEV
jgi:AI-2 transport protein TqsA